MQAFFPLPHTLHIHIVAFEFGYIKCLDEA